MPNPPKMMQPPPEAERDGVQDDFEPSPYASSLASDGAPSVSHASPHTPEAKQASKTHLPPQLQEETTKPESIQFVEKTAPLGIDDFVEETTPPAGVAKDAAPPQSPVAKGLTSLPAHLLKDNTAQPTTLPKGLSSPPAGVNKDATPHPTAIPKGLTSLPIGVSKDNTAQPAPLPKGLTSPPTTAHKDVTPQPSLIPKGLMSLPSGISNDATPQPNAVSKGLTASPKKTADQPSLRIHQPPAKSAEDFDNQDDAYVFESTGIASSLAEAPKSNAQIRTSLPTKETKKDPLIGKIIGSRFALHKKLGQGGMGAVYQATDQRTNEEVAVKILPMQLSKIGRAHV